MRGVKRILASDTLRRVLCWLGAQYIRFVSLTGRWSVVRGHIPRALWDAGQPFIVCFWHGRLLMMSRTWESRVPIRVVISQHRDGQLIARTIGHLGFHSIAGSTRRGGAGALRSMLKALQGGECVGITPDGPRGPRMRASDGIVSAARLAGVPIVPVTFAVDRRKVLGTWDRFIVAGPFARGVVAWGEPITVARDADEGAQEEARRRIEDTLNAITAEADGLCGVASVEPAPAPSRGEAAS